MHVNTHSIVKLSAWVHFCIRKLCTSIYQSYSSSVANNTEREHGPAPSEFTAAILNEYSVAGDKRRNTCDLLRAPITRMVLAEPLLLLFFTYILKPSIRSLQRNGSDSLQYTVADVLSDLTRRRLGITRGPR